MTAEIQTVEALIAKLGSRAFRDDAGNLLWIEHGTHGFGGRYLWSFADYVELANAGKLKALA